MKERRHKVHFSPLFITTLCGLDGTTTRCVNDTTCRICMFRYLASQATWAQSFLDELRGRVGRGQPAAVTVPAGLTEPVHAVVERAGRRLGRPFRQERGSEKAISELLVISPAVLASIKPIVHASGPSAESVGVENRQVAQYARNAGQVGDEAGGNDQSPELWGTPDERSRNRP